MLSTSSALPSTVPFARSRGPSSRLLQHQTAVAKMFRATYGAVPFVADVLISGLHIIACDLTVLAITIFATFRLTTNDNVMPN